MAKWRLTSDHYLNVVCDEYGEKIDYEYSETDQQTNRVRRRSWDVPMLIGREKIVTNKQEDFDAFGGDTRERPVLFKGDPTPDMQPIDEEAKAISAKLQPKWRHAIESLPTTYNGDYSASLIAGFEKLLTQAAAQQKPVELPNTPAPNISNERLDAMQKQIEQLMEMNMRLMAEKAGEQVPAPKAPPPAKAAPAAPERRV